MGDEVQGKKKLCKLETFIINPLSLHWNRHINRTSFACNLVVYKPLLSLADTGRGFSHAQTDLIYAREEVSSQTDGACDFSYRCGGDFHS